VDELGHRLRRPLRRGTVRQRLSAVVMLLALMPALTFFGHWACPYLKAPAADAALAIASSAHAHAEHGLAHLPRTGVTDHSHQGYGESGGLGARSNVQAPLALLNEATIFSSVILMAGLVALGAWRPSRVMTISPQLPPPRPVPFA
jgi:hypothetical protein